MAGGVPQADAGLSAGLFRAPDAPAMRQCTGRSSDRPAATPEPAREQADRGA